MKFTPQFYVLIILVLLFGAVERGQSQVEGDRKTCSNRNDFETIRNHEKLSDQEKVQRMVPYIHDCVQKLEQTEKDEKRDDIAMHLNSKLYFLATKGRGKNLSKRPKPIRQFIDSMEKSEWSSFEQLRRTLYIALGYAGGDPPKGVLLSTLTADNTPHIILGFTLDAMANSRVPIRSLPRLMELSDHSYKTETPNHVGKIDTLVNYPIREGVCKCLNQLDISCEKRSTVEEKEQEQTIATGETKTWTERKKITDIQIDRSALVERMRTWLLSNDPTTWKPAMDAVRHIEAEDVQKMFKQLKTEGKLSEQKRSYYNERNPRSRRERKNSGRW